MAQLDDVEQLARHEQKFGEGKGRKILFFVVCVKSYVESF